MSAAHALRTRLKAPGVLPMPGVHDGLSVRLAAEAGFAAAFVSGAGISLSRFGKPDLGFVSATDVVNTVAAMSSAADIALLVDIDTGFGNALNARHTVRAMERAGAAGVQIEDQTFPKRCGHLAGKDVIPAAEMAGKVRGVCDARLNADTIVVARTDALAVRGLEEALDRAELYLEAGADAVFVEAPRSIDDMRAIARRIGARAPLVHNFVEGGGSPVRRTADLEALGYKIALFPLLFLHAAAPAQRSLLNHLKATGGTQGWTGALADLHALNDAAGLDGLLRTGAGYGAEEASSSTLRHVQGTPSSGVQS